MCLRLQSAMTLLDMLTFLSGTLYGTLRVLVVFAVVGAGRGRKGEVKE